jgi:hypothetical protein
MVGLLDGLSVLQQRRQTMREFVGPCLCGAPDCPSCGPAQGYSACDICGKYACEDHVLCDVCERPFSLDDLTTDNKRRYLCSECLKNHEEDN